MAKSKRSKWRYIAIPIELAEEMTQVVEADRYPMGYWHSKDHLVIEAIKEKLAKIKEKTEKKETQATR
jgi:hypothetical protein